MSEISLWSFYQISGGSAVKTAREQTWAFLCSRLYLVAVMRGGGGGGGEEEEEEEERFGFITSPKHRLCCCCCQTAASSWSAPSTAQYHSALFSSSGTSSLALSLALSRSLSLALSRSLSLALSLCSPPTERQIAPNCGGSSTSCRFAYQPLNHLWVCELSNVCVYIYEWTGAWRGNRTPVSEWRRRPVQAPVAAGWKLPADIHTVAARLIARLSSLKGKAAVRFMLPLPAFVAEQGLISKCCFSLSCFCLIGTSGLVLYFSVLVSEVAECIDPCLQLHTYSPFKLCIKWICSSSEIDAELSAPFTAASQRFLWDLVSSVLVSYCSMTFHGNPLCLFWAIRQSDKQTNKLE